jgi:hypothetical protein
MAYGNERKRFSVKGVSDVRVQVSGFRFWVQVLGSGSGFRFWVQGMFSVKGVKVWGWYSHV